MKYDKELPTGMQIRSLAEIVTFPAAREDMVLAADPSGTMADFLDLFYEDQIFESEADFIEKCEELAVLIEEEREAEKEMAKNPQE